VKGFIAFAVLLSAGVYVLMLTGGYAIRWDHTEKAKGLFITCDYLSAQGWAVVDFVYDARGIEGRSACPLFLGPLPE
jgi:hypothetical protein